MKRGFTLVELLAVIVLLSVLALMATVSTGKIIKNARNDMSEVQLKVLEEATKMYTMKEVIHLFNGQDAIKQTCVNVVYLINNGYLESSEIKDVNTDEVMNGSMIIKYEGKNFVYKYQDTQCN